MPKSIRRIVTGHDDGGRSVILSDAAAPTVFGSGAGGAGADRDARPGRVAVTELWATRESPAPLNDAADPTNGPFRLEPPVGGSSFRVVEYPPDSKRFPGWTGSAGGDRTPHPGFHITQTIDYAIVLSGEIYAVMDEGEALMKPGDVLVQRATNHAWSNRGDEPALVAFVLLPSTPG